MTPKKNHLKRMIRHIIVGLTAGTTIPIAIVGGIGGELQQDDEISGQGPADLL